MAIKGLTHRKDAMMFRRIGSLRKGAQKTANRPGKDLGKFFRFDTEDEGIRKAFYEVYGSEPSNIRVFFPYDEVDRVWTARKEAWSKSKLLHACNGEYCYNILDEKTGDRIVDEDLSQEIPCPNDGSCKEVGRLTVVIPELLEKGVLGVVTVPTTSLYDIMNIDGWLRGYDGKLTGTEFILSRVKQNITTPTKFGRQDKWLITLTPSAKWVQAMFESRLTLGAGVYNNAPQLESSNHVEAEFVEDEEEIILIEGDLFDALSHETVLDQLISELWPNSFTEAKKNLTDHFGDNYDKMLSSLEKRKKGLSDPKNFIKQLKSAFGLDDDNEVLEASLMSALGVTEMPKKIDNPVKLLQGYGMMFGGELTDLTELFDFYKN